MSHLWTRPTILGVLLFVHCGRNIGKVDWFKSWGNIFKKENPCPWFVNIVIFKLLLNFYCYRIINFKILLQRKTWHLRHNCIHIFFPCNVVGVIITIIINLLSLGTCTPSLVYSSNSTLLFTAQKKFLFSLSRENMLIDHIL